MEFWGVEVKAGQPLKVKPTFDNIIHLSQASLGETKKDKAHDSVPVFVKFGDKKLVLGTLITDTIPQLSFDLVFEKEFELSHNWKNGSVYFCGYQTPLPAEGDSEEFDMDESEEEEEELPAVAATANGKAPKVENAKPAAKAPAPKADAKPAKDVKPKEEDDDDSDDSDDSMEDASDEDDSDEISGEDVDSEDDDDSDEDESDEETPKKVDVGKKRPGASAQKTPVSNKKAKAGTPQTDGKKGGHVATPHPSKQGAKTPANDKTPKSAGQHSCKSCSKTFGSDGALQSHTKAKHSGAK